MGSPIEIEKKRKKMGKKERKRKKKQKCSKCAPLNRYFKRSKVSSGYTNTILVTLPKNCEKLSILATF